MESPNTLDGQDAISGGTPATTTATTTASAKGERAFGRALGMVAVVALLGAGAVFNGVLEPTDGRAAPAAAAVQAVPVGVKTISAQPVRLWQAYSGRMRAVDQAQIRPEVSGRVARIDFADGQIVRAGDVLMVIDPGPYEAAVAKAEANLTAARTGADFAATELERAGNLIKTKAVAERVYDERQNADRVARAAVLVAEAELRQARIDLDRAYVKAPITGRISRAEITVGNLVQAGPNAPILTTIVSNDGIYADFEVDEQTYIKSLRAQTDTRANARRVPVEVILASDGADHGAGNGGGRTIAGHIESFDNHIDTASGTIRARARFDNADGALVPGMFVSVRLATATETAALLVPERAVGNDLSKKFVYVVDGEEKVAYREVRLGATIDGQRMVLSGVNPGDRVIVSGLQQVRPSVPVQVREANADGVADKPTRLAAN